MQACTPPDLHLEVAGDCDDRDAEVHPGATEYCNAADDDCDGTVDPDAALWYADADGDSFGTVDLTITACTPPSGFVAIAGDCDDGDPSVKPGGGPETCDGRDEDCDGLVDEDVTGDTTWYPDDDDDGFGADAEGVAVCVVPTGWIAVSGDCDDGDGDVNPNVSESCDTPGVDDDCDGLEDDDDPSVTDEDDWYPDLDGDGVGAGSAVLACFPPAGTVASSDDCDDADPTAYPNATEVCGGSDEDCDGLLDDLDPDIDPTSLADGWLDADLDDLGDPAIAVATCMLGDGVAGNDLDCDDADPQIGVDQWMPDTDGDGAGAGAAVPGVGCVGPPEHVNVAAPIDCANDDAARYPGAPDPCGDGVDGDCTGIDPFCSPDLSGFLGIESIGRGFVEGTFAGGGTGMVLAVHDFDLDGFADLAAGAPGEDLVRVLRGPGPEDGGPWSVAQEIAGVVAGDAFGVSLAGIPGDAGGPGRLLIGAPNHDLTGAAFVIADALAPADPLLAATILYGVGSGDRTGEAVIHLGDVDGTGTSWFAAGSPGYLTGAFTISAVDGGTHDLLAASALVTGAGDLGAQLAGGRDHDGDGILDVVAAAPLRTAENGVVFVVPGDTTGTVGVAAVAAAELQGVLGGRLGTAVAAGDDLVGDGLSDLAATAPLDDSESADAGVAYAFEAPAGIAVAAGVAMVTIQGTAGLALGQDIALADLDGDGWVDLLVSATSADVSGQDGGAVYAFFAPEAGTYTTIDADLVLYGAAGVTAGDAFEAGWIDGDPTPDLVIGLPSTSAGAVWLVPGAP